MHAGSLRSSHRNGGTAASSCLRPPLRCPLYVHHVHRKSCSGTNCWQFTHSPVAFLISYCHTSHSPLVWTPLRAPHAHGDIPSLIPRALRTVATSVAPTRVVVDTYNGSTVRSLVCVAPRSSSAAAPALTPFVHFARSPGVLVASFFFFPIRCAVGSELPT